MTELSRSLPGYNGRILLLDQATRVHGSRILVVDKSSPNSSEILISSVLTSRMLELDLLGRKNRAPLKVKNDPLRTREVEEMK